MSLWMNPVNRPDDYEKCNARMKKVIEWQKAYPDAMRADLGPDFTLADMQAAYLEERKMWNVGDPACEISEDIALTYGDGYPVNIRHYVYKKSDEKLPVIFYMHGGSWCLGNNDTHDTILRKMAKYSRVNVIGIDYTLLYCDDKFSHEDIVKEIVMVIDYCTEHADEMGLDMTRFGFGGDSAGANLSMAACIMLRDNGFDMSKVRANVLYYGAYGLPMMAPSAYLHGGPLDGMPESESMDLMANKENKYRNIYSNDLRQGMPPCFIVAAELDPIHDDSVLMYNVLKGLGYEVQFTEYKGVLHSFVVYSRLVDEAEDAIRRGAHWYDEHFGVEVLNEDR